MYNELQKLRYLENCKYDVSTREMARRRFSSAARIENRYNKDLAEFNRFQVIELLKSYNSNSPHSLQVMCVIFADYYNWCLQEKLIDPSNVVNQYDSSMVKGIIDRIVPLHLIKGKFFTKEDVLGYLDSIEDVSNKFIVWALFSGVKGDNYFELSNLKMEDLDEENKVVKVGGRLHPVDDLFINLMKRTDEATYYAPTGEYKHNRYCYDKSIYVLKNCISGKVDTPVNLRYYTLRLQAIKKQTGNKLITASTLYKNGLINHIKEYYDQKGIHLSDAVFQCVNKKSYTYDNETEEVINKYGSKMTARVLRSHLKDTIDYYV